jgi:pyruvate/2-oxoglutarate dehydrogenase complex dihydrolipoamide dehydrogenase (E3) component
MTRFPALAPFDDHNRELAANTHPDDWTNPTPPSEPYHLVVIGGGTAGLVASAVAVGLGARVALIERELLGGDCLNVGCVPSKALIRCARAAADVRDAARFGVTVSGPVEVDFGLVMERMRRLRARIAPNDSAARFRDLGADVYFGQATFSASDTIEVAGASLRFKRAVIATGARASALPIPGLAESGYLTNETVFSLERLPARLAVLGAGPIGCELAQSFARFGSEVHVVEVAPQILVREDRDAARIVEAALLRDGVALHLGTSLKRVSVRDGAKVLELESGGDGGRANELRVDALLVGVGRTPNVDGLGLETVGVEFDSREGVTVDDHLQTTNPRIFAAGDVASPFKFTHAADFQARIVVQNALFSIAGLGRGKASRLTIPWVTYTDPEVAHVGLYESDAAERGIEIDTYHLPLDEVDRAILDGEDEGFFKVHAKKGTPEIVGATLVARHAGEMISEITLAMTSGAGLGGLAKTIHPYPTQAEVFRKAGDAFNRTRLTPMAKRLLDLLLKLK